MEKLKHYPVPAGTQSTECRGRKCGAKMYWIKTANDKNMPVDCDHCEECREPSDSAPLFGDMESRDCLGVSHFETCTDANAFSRRSG